MRSVLAVLLLSAVAISAAISSDFKPSPRYRPTLGLIKSKEIISTQEFEDVVKFLEYNLSPKEIQELLDTIPEALEAADESEVSANDGEQLVAQARSVGGAIENVFEHIPWGTITDALKKMSKNNPKITKVLNLVGDQKFRDLVKKAVNSHTLRDFVKGVAQHGFSWTEFLHLLLHALCSTATTIQHDKYSVGVCQVLKNV